MATTDEDSAKKFRDIVAAAHLSPEHSRFLLMTLEALLRDRVKGRDEYARYKITNVHVTEAKLRAIEEKEAAITERDNALLDLEAARAEFSWMSEELDELRMRRDTDKDLISELRENRDKLVDEVNDLKETFKSQEAKVDAVLVDAINEVRGAQTHLAARVKSVAALVCSDLEHAGSPIHDSLEDDLTGSVTLSYPKLSSIPALDLTMEEMWPSPVSSQQSSIHAGQESPGQPTDDGDIIFNQDPLPRTPSLPVSPANGPHNPDILVNKPRPPTAVRAPLGLHSTAERVIGIASGRGAQHGQSGSMTTVSRNLSAARSGNGLFRVDPARLTAGLKRRPSFTKENLTSSKRLKQTDGTSVKKVNHL